MSSIFGIHFGASSACIAVCRDGKSQIIANDLGDRVTPAVVAFHGSEVSVGLAAKHNALRNSENTIFNVKKIIGKDYNDADVHKVISKQKVKIINRNNKPTYQVMYQDRLAYYEPLEIVKLIYKKMMETAKSFGCPSNSYDCVITVPVYFNEKQRTLMRLAAESAGFNVLRIINECSSALLAYNIGQTDADARLTVLVFRAGGRSVDVSIVRVLSGLYRVVAHHHDDDLGGNAIDDVLVRFLAEEFKRQSRLDCTSNERSLSKLRMAVENCKHALSNLSTSTCSVESLFEGVDFSCVISRSRLDALSTPFIQSCLCIIKRLIEKAGLKLIDIDKVIMSGGVSKMALLQQNIHDLLPLAEFLSNINCDEVIAEGAAIQASILHGRNPDETKKFSEFCDLTCLSEDICIELQKGGCQVLFEKYTPIPFRRQVHFSLGQGQQSAVLHLFQKTRPTKNKLGTALKISNGGNDNDDSNHGNDDGNHGNDNDNDEGWKNSITSLLKIVLPRISDDGIVDAQFHLKHDGSMHVICTADKITQDYTLEGLTTTTSPRKHVYRNYSGDAGNDDESRGNSCGDGDDGCGVGGSSGGGKGRVKVDDLCDKTTSKLSALGLDN